MLKNTRQLIEMLNNGKQQEVIALLEKYCKKKPKIADNWTMLGFIYGDIGYFDKAEACLRRAVNLENGEAYTFHPFNALASLLIQNQKYSEAITYLQKSLKLNPRQAGVYFDLAGCFKEERRIGDAVNAYLRSLELNPDQYLAYRALGQLYEQIHQLDNARKYAELALGLSSGDVESHFLLAKLDARDNNYEMSKKRLHDLLDMNLSSHQKAIVLLELGMVQDKLGQYAEAFGSITEGNKLLEALYKPHQSESGLVEYRQEIKSYESIFTRGMANSWNDIGFDQKKLNIIFLVGFPRSGTTLTEQILESHSNIVGTHELPVIPRLTRKIDKVIGREFTYPNDISSLNNTEINLLRKAYLCEMKAGLNQVFDKNKYLLDKLPLNIVHIGFISKIFPDAKILLALRDPRDVCLSCFMQTFKLNQAMRQFLDIENTIKFYVAVMNLWLYYKDILNIDYLETRYEDIVENLEKSARVLLDFIGLDWEENILKFYESAKSRQVYTPSYQGVIRPIYRGSIGKWKRYEQQLSKSLPLLKQLLKSFQYNE